VLDFCELKNSFGVNSTGDTLFDPLLEGGRGIQICQIVVQSSNESPQPPLWTEKAPSKGGKNALTPPTLDVF
jgi:hypothetical protein